MSEIPHELIRQVQISTRAAANLSDYDPSDPTLPQLPSLSAEIAASDSSPHIRCVNCKGRLLRGSESIICLYCGRRPNYDALPDPICFTSSVGYKWLLRSLRLDGSEMVDPRNKTEQEIPLSDFLNFKIHWPSEAEKQDTSISDNLSKQSRSFSLTGVDPVKFFSQLNRNVTSDPSTKQPIEHKKVGTVDKKSVEAPDHQNLFQNVHSSEPMDISSPRENSDDFSEWRADFQFAGSQNEESSHKSPEQFADFSDSGNNFQVSKSVDYSMGSEVDLTAEIDSVFGRGGEINDGTQKENPAAHPAFDDDLWSNLSSIKPHSGGGLGATDSANDAHEAVNTLEYDAHEAVNTLESSRDLATSADLLQDFQLQPNYADMSLNKTENEEQKAMDLDAFGEWNDFTGFSTLQGSSQTGTEFQISTPDKKSPEIDLFNFDNNFDEEDFGGFQQPNLFSASNSNSDSLPEFNAAMSENPASIRSNDSAVSSSDMSGQPANNGDAMEKSTKEDDIMKLLSQMHDLSFMLETDLSIPAASDTNNFPLKD